MEFSLCFIHTEKKIDGEFDVIEGEGGEVFKCFGECCTNECNDHFWVGPEKASKNNCEFLGNGQ